MRKWVCNILCLALLAGIVSVPADASENVDTGRQGTEWNQADAMALRAAVPDAESAAVETGSVESPAPSAVPTQAPVFGGNKVVKSEDVFVTTENAEDKSCTITGYKGDTGVTTLYIPDEIKGKTVKNVTEGVFANCVFLKNLVVYGDTELAANNLFAAGTSVEIWAKTGSKANTYALQKSLVFHAIEGPAAISGKKATSLNRATVTWSAVNGAQSYNIYRKRGKEQYAVYKNMAALTFTNERLKVGATYSFKVSPVFLASNGDMVEGLASKETSVSLKPSKVKSVRAKGIRGGVQVRWKRNKNVSGYQVYMKVHVKGFKTNFARVKTISKNKITRYRNTMLVRGMKYSYKVRAFKRIKGKNIYGPFVTVTTKAK